MRFFRVEVEMGAAADAARLKEVGDIWYTIAREQRS